MNTERLLREVEKRLAHLSDSDRAEALDAVREELARERRRVSMVGSVEVERERRPEAETLREILEVIHRQPSLEPTVGEVLNKRSRIVVVDSCSLARVDQDASSRVLSAR